jgi:hypothetical protein
MATGNPRTLDALSAAVFHFARNLTRDEKKALLVALEDAQGTRSLFGLRNSAAMKKLKKADPNAFQRFVDAKDALRN